MCRTRSPHAPLAGNWPRLGDWTGTRHSTPHTFPREAQRPIITEASAWGRVADSVIMAPNWHHPLMEGKCPRAGDCINTLSRITWWNTQQLNSDASQNHTQARRAHVVCPWETNPWLLNTHQWLHGAGAIYCKRVWDLLSGWGACSVLIVLMVTQLHKLVKVTNCALTMGTSHCMYNFPHNTLHTSKNLVLGFFVFILSIFYLNSI